MYLMFSKSDMQQADSVCRFLMMEVHDAEYDITGWSMRVNCGCFTASGNHGSGKLHHLLTVA